MKKDLNMSDVRYLEALKRIRALIAGGRKLTGANSDEIGNKYNACSWGFCAEDKESWPDAEDHLWPDQFLGEGRVAPKYRKGHQYCPLCKKKQGMGCFYSCLFFQRQRPTREEALRLYDEAIEEAQRNLKCH